MFDKDFATTHLFPGSCIAHDYPDYRVSNFGLWYSPGTPITVIQTLDRLNDEWRKGHQWHKSPDRLFRVRLWYGDRDTGRSWGFWGSTDIGYIGRSTGTKPIPLSIHNLRSMGGGGILTNSIVRIDRAALVNGRRLVLYQHPLFHLDIDSLNPGEDKLLF